MEDHHGKPFVVSVRRRRATSSRRRDVPRPRSSTPGGSDAPGTRPSPPTLRGPRRSRPPCRASPAAFREDRPRRPLSATQHGFPPAKAASHRFSQTALRGLCRRERRRPLSAPERCRRPGEEDRARTPCFHRRDDGLGAEQ